MPDRKADTPFYVGLCDRMRTLRINYEITQEAVAHTLGMQMQRVSKIERGGVRPSVEVVAGYALMFDVDIRWLLTGDADKIEIVAPEGKSKKITTKLAPPGHVEQPAEKKIKKKIKEQGPPPKPRPPVDPATLWRPSAWAKKS